MLFIVTFCRMPIRGSGRFEIWLQRILNVESRISFYLRFNLFHLKSVYVLAVFDINSLFLFQSFPKNRAIRPARKTYSSLLHGRFFDNCNSIVIVLCNFIVFALYIECYLLLKYIYFAY